MIPAFLQILIIFSWSISLIDCGASEPGPLRVSDVNPRYFTDYSGRAVYMTGSHTWANLMDIGPTDPPGPFDFDAYLNFLEGYGHNFIRLWNWELVKRNTAGNASRNRSKEPEVHTVSPHPWKRTGPGTATDGKPKFDLTQFEDDYFNRLRIRIRAAGDRKIYVAVMLFEGWGLRRKLESGWNAWEDHPFHPANNINGIDSNVNGDSQGLEVHEPKDSETTAVQEAYVKKVIDTVNDLDNVLFEIGNEIQPASEDWQIHMINFIRDYEAEKPKQHPVGLTTMKPGDNAKLLNEIPADWVSPTSHHYQEDPPTGMGHRVILSDSDHTGGVWGSQAWVWKSFCRGLNPIFMDPYDAVVIGRPFDPLWEPVRVNMGYARRYADRMDLIHMIPRNDAASTGYCLANQGKEYLVYAPEGGDMVIDLSMGSGEMAVEWFDSNTGEARTGETVPAGARRTFSSPFGEADYVVYVKLL